MPGVSTIQGESNAGSGPTAESSARSTPSSSAHGSEAQTEKHLQASVASPVERADLNVGMESEETVADVGWRMPARWNDGTWKLAEVIHRQINCVSQTFEYYVHYVEYNRRLVNFIPRFNSAS
eukprot:SAG31_NODE_205_length_20397_cov_19.191152_1_plen_123_part_00